jgi:hypothetical protein
MELIIQPFTIEAMKDKRTPTVPMKIGIQAIGWLDSGFVGMEIQ